jgi:hypothetical protein
MNTTFGVGNVLATGFRVWARNFVPFLLITALIYAPALIWETSAIPDTLTRASIRDAFVVVRYATTLLILLNVLVSAALTYGVVMELQGQRASIGACIATGLTRFVPALGVAFLTCLCVAGGVVLLVVGSIVLYCMLYVSVQCSVLERPGVLGALKRSRALTEGHRFEIFGLLLILVLINYGLTKAVESVTLSNLRSLAAYVYANLAQQMLIGSLGAVMASVTYFFLRAEKEGTSATELAAVFD